MNLDESYAELGVDADVDDDTLRRAYLRQLKTRKPEVDPEGFQRLREAYELVREFRRLGLSIAAAYPHVVLANPPVEEATAPEETVPTHIAKAEPDEQATLDDALRIARRVLRDTLEGDHDLMATETEDVIQLALTLQVNGRAVDARKLTARLRKCFAHGDNELAMLRETHPAHWIAVRELAALPDDFPEDVRTIIARAASIGDTDDASWDLRRLQRDHPKDARRATQLLKRHAPRLHAIYYQQLLGNVEEGSRTWSMQWGFGGGAIFVALMLFRLLGRSCDSTPSAGTPPRSITLPGLKSTATATATAFEPSAGSFQTAETFATTADRVDAPEVASAARALGTDLGAGKCGMLIEHFAAIRDTMKRLTKQKHIALGAELQVLREAAVAACPPLTMRDLP